MPMYGLSLMHIFSWLVGTVSIFFFIFKYRKIQIKEGPYFIMFHPVLNFICFGGPRSDFVISTSRFFSKSNIRFAIN